jgi:hypothetical protein
MYVLDTLYVVPIFSCTSSTVPVSTVPRTSKLSKLQYQVLYLVQHRYQVLTHTCTCTVPGTWCCVVSDRVVVVPGTLWLHGLNHPRTILSWRTKKRRVSINPKLSVTERRQTVKIQWLMTWSCPYTNGRFLGNNTGDWALSRLSRFEWESSW